MNTHVLIFLAWALPAILLAKSNRADLGSDELERYFAKQVAELEHPLETITDQQGWETHHEQLRDELHEMLGLKPLPERTDLQPVVTGTIEREDFRVEKLHFQSSPGLYVTGNLYLPKNQGEGPFPTILYVCGHARVKEDGVSYGNKVGYHHHGIWFARQGYVCLLIDTIQLGEIEGVHHGTFRYDRWWWNARGYTPAGVEAWNSIRALDYLETRPEVDPERMGVTGRSGGGAYSWWTATLDRRIKAAVPVAGITSLRNHVVDGCIEGHCDCMFPVNTFRWDFANVAALVSPRPLLISNTDKDGIFPLNGVMDVFWQTKRIYELQDASSKLGLNIEEGPHTDTQPLRTSAFHWFNRHLRGGDIKAVHELAAVKGFAPQELKVFDAIPEDEIVTTIDESFVPLAETPAVPQDQKEWETLRDGWRNELKRLSFAGWPNTETQPEAKKVFSDTRQGLTFEVYDVHPEGNVTTKLYLARREGLELKDLQLHVLNLLDETDWNDFLTHVPSLFPEAFPGIELPAPDEESLQAELKMHQTFKWGMAYLCPRGIGPVAWSDEPKKQIQIRRRFSLIGQTLDGMRSWDCRQGVIALREAGLGETPVWLQAAGDMAGNALYASLFLEKPVARLDLHDLSTSHHEGPIYLNVLRVLDLPQAVAMAAERSKLRIYTEDKETWTFPLETATAMGWEKSIDLRTPVETGEH